MTATFLVIAISSLDPDGSDTVTSRCSFTPMR